MTRSPIQRWMLMMVRDVLAMQPRRDNVTPCSWQPSDLEGARLDGLDNWEVKYCFSFSTG